MPPRRHDARHVVYTVNKLGYVQVYYLVNSTLTASLMWRCRGTNSLLVSMSHEPREQKSSSVTRRSHNVGLLYSGVRLVSPGTATDCYPFFPQKLTTFFNHRPLKSSVVTTPTLRLPTFKRRLSRVPDVSLPGWYHSGRSAPPPPRGPRPPVVTLLGLVFNRLQVCNYRAVTWFEGWIAKKSPARSSTSANLTSNLRFCGFRQIAAASASEPACGVELLPFPHLQLADCAGSLTAHSVGTCGQLAARRSTRPRP